MAYEHKLQAKLDYFAKMKHDAVMCLIEMGAKLENEHVEQAGQKTRGAA